MSLFSQSTAVTVMTLKGLPSRFAMSFAAVLAVAVVVMVFLGFQSLTYGFKKTIEGAGSDDIGIITRAGSRSELNSVILRDQLGVLEGAPGIARGEDGQRLISGELYAIIDAVKKSSGFKANIPLRGVDQEGFALREHIALKEGRLFETGRNEVIVGAGAAGVFEGFELGKSLKVGQSQWEIVGIFSSGGSVFESEIWGDRRVVQSQFRRGDSVQSVRVRLDDKRTEAEKTACITQDQNRVLNKKREKALKEGKNQTDLALLALSAAEKKEIEKLCLSPVKPIMDYVRDDPRLNFDVETEKSYFSSQSSALNNLAILGFALSLLMSVGALTGALNSMYQSVASRAREIATLRAIGFSGYAAFLATLVEALMLALFGGLVGVLLAYLAFDGVTSSTLGASFTQVVFRFDFSAGMIENALILALCVGFVGGFFPAFRAARLPVVVAFGAGE